MADSGGDKCVNIFAHGCLAIEQEAWKANEDELMKSCRRTYGNARRWESSITYDATGVGAFCGSKFEEINEEEDGADIAHQKFQAGGQLLTLTGNTPVVWKTKTCFSNLKGPELVECSRQAPEYLGRCDQRHPIP